MNCAQARVNLGVSCALREQSAAFVSLLGNTAVPHLWPSRMCGQCLHFLRSVCLFEEEEIVEGVWLERLALV